MKKRGLGKGLEALLGSENVVVPQSSSSQSQVLSIDLLIPNPYQPRVVFNAQAIDSLSESIKRHGIIQPLAVRLVSGANEQYEIIAGERRFRAAKQAGLKEVPVIIHNVSDSDSAAFALIENLQREDLNVIEKAKGISRLIEQFSLTHEACGQVLGHSRSSISNTLRLLELSEVVQQAISDKQIDMGHARALLPLEQAEQYEVLKAIKLNGLTVRETEALVRGAMVADEKRPPKMQKNEQVIQAQEKLSEGLKTKVNISQQKNGKGKITLNFDDEEMLNTLIKRMGLS